MYTSRLFDATEAENVTGPDPLLDAVALRSSVVNGSTCQLSGGTVETVIGVIV